MTLLAYIKSCVDVAVESNSKKGSRHTGYSQTLKSLSLFIGNNNDPQLIAAIDPKFISDYAKYLFSGNYAADYTSLGLPNNRDIISERTLEKHLRTLRAIIRQAISDGLLPPVDVFPEVFGQIAQQFNVKAFDIGSTQSKRPSAKGYQKQFELLARCISKDLADKNRVRFAMPALLYVLGIYCNGTELTKLLTAKVDKAGNTSIPLSERARNVLALLNRGKPTDGFMVRRHAGWDERDSQKLANKLTSDITAYFKHCGIKLFASQSIMIDWLSFAKEHKMSDQLAIDIAFAKVSATEIPAFFADTIANDRGAFVKRWHVLCSYSQSILSDKLKTVVMRDLSGAGISYNAKRDFYDPQDIRKFEVKGRMRIRNNSVLSKLLFVRCLASTAAFIDRDIDKAALMRDPGNRSIYATVPHQAIVQLAQMLNDFRDDIELIGLQVPSNLQQLDKGVRVRILNGPFQGFEGTIDEIKNAATGNEDKIFRVSVEGFSGSAAASLKGIELDPI